MEIKEAIELFAGYIAFCEEHHQDVDLRADKIALQTMEEKARKSQNPPLTLEELRGMGGEPVYIVHREHTEENGWVVSDGWDDDFDEFLAANVDGWHAGCYGETWIAYRRKPEEETT